MTDKKLQQNTHSNAVDPDKFHKMVAECAYCKAEARGFAAGYDLEDWLEAEREVNNPSHNSSQEV